MAGPDETGGVPDEIAGLPGAMTTYALVGPTGSGGYMFDGTASLVPGMEEANAFVAKDNKASEHLAKFLQAAAFGFDGYTNRAKDAGHDYLATDDRAAAGLRSIGTVTHQAV